MQDQKALAPGLEAAIVQGARRRHPFYLGFLGAAAPAIAAGGLIAFTIYFVVMVSAGRSDWSNIILGGSAALSIPGIALCILLIGTNRSHPLTVSIVATVFAASFAVATASAVRIPVSYIGFLLTLPSSIFFVTFANVSMARHMRRSVVLLSFPGAHAVVTAAKWAMPISEPDDISSQYRRVLIDPITHHTPEWSAHLTKMYLRGLDIETWPSYLESTLGKVDLKTFDLADLSYKSSQINYYRLKRAFDIFGVIILAIPAALICSLIWLYIRALDGGPSIFVQERRGFAGSNFRLMKFRTMYRGNHVGSTAASDIRVIPGCLILRQLRLDELPQLFNILRGDMSFIGPRPVAIDVAEALEERIPLYVHRQILVPGLTGWAQVSQGYAESEDEEIEKLAFDLYYLKNVSLDLDVIIIFRTIKTVLFRVGSR